MNIQDEFYKSITQNDIKNVNFLLTNKNFDPSIFSNLAIVKASKLGYIDIVKLLLNDKRVNPADRSNLAIILAFENKYFEIGNLLWQDQRIKNSLENNNKQLYNKLIFQDNIEFF